MYHNYPVGPRPMPGFLTNGTRPMGGAPTMPVAPPAPSALDGSPAGPSATMNLQNLARSVWRALCELAGRVVAAIHRATAPRYQ